MVSTRKKPAQERVRKPAKKQKEYETDEHSDDFKDDDEEEEEEEAALDSDALDDEDEGPRKRKRASPAKKKAIPRKRRKKNDGEDEVELEEGQEIVGEVVQAPATGRVPAGQISKNTFDFLTHLKDPACNDREWFKLHEPVYRLAEKEWKDFVEEFTALLTDVDAQIPPLPPKDVIHRIYRDVRFSNDKTPYKKGFSASFSRSGRKGVFACYHVAIKPGNESLIAAGAWCPGKNELATIRSHIQRSSKRLRTILSKPEFTEYFGEPRLGPGGKRQSIFGADDELKVAPKGIDKNHKDIDLLKCRSFAVVHYFTDEQVLAPGFKEELAEVARIMMPFVHCLNDMMTLPAQDDSDEESDGSQEEDQG